MKVLIIGGATASGKTSFAIQCAKRFDGEIVSCDSMQIYKDLNIGTAKPTEEEIQQATHHMIDVVEAGDSYSVQQYVTSARKIVEDIYARGKLPIVVGGTGLYIRGLLYPYSFANAPKNSEIRDKYNQILQEKGKEYLFDLLRQVDPISCEKISINDTKKVVRALEIFEITGKPKSCNVCQQKPIYDSIFVALNPPREILYDRINKRVDRMFEQGLEKEIENFLNTGKVTRNSQSMQAIGYKEFFDYFDGKQSIEETKEIIKQNSRRYAKRQLTFFRGFEDVFWFDPQDEDIAFDYISKRLSNKQNIAIQ
ncbi:MAG: tRNA (adenosine(37)-N6)-dimethylallyltransferase MiaA [Christensenellales bacterium]